MNKLFKIIGLLFFLVGISACGDEAFTTDGEVTTATTDGTTGTTGGLATTVASLTLIIDATSIGSGTSDEVNIIARVKDAANNVVSGATVLFVTDGGSLTVLQGTTDSLGEATAKLSSIGDPRNRSILISATSDAATDSISVTVEGTAISISGGTTMVSGDVATLTLTLADSSGAGLAGETIVVTTSGGNTITDSTNSGNSSTSSINVTTDTNGQAQVDFTAVASGAIGATALGASQSKTITISPDAVTFVTNFPADADLAIATTHEVRVNWLDTGVAVNGGTINFSATRGIIYSDAVRTSVVASAVTDASGNASVWVESSNAGPTVIRAQISSGLEKSIEREFVAPVSGASLLILQADKSTIGPNGETAVLTAIIRDGQNNFVKNVNVQFSIQTDVSGGSLTDSNTVTDSLGRATTTYVSSAATTPADGVVIRAVINEAGMSCSLPAADTDCEDFALTVAQQELFIRMGTSNLMQVLDDTRYQKTYNVIVTDSGGNAVENKNITVNFIPTHYYKGYRQWDEENSVYQTITTATCVSEDVDKNGVLTTGEDTNGNGMLDPGNVAAVQSNVVTDATGFALFDIVFAKSYARWAKMDLTAITQVDGTESSDDMAIRLPILLSDISTKGSVPGAVSPWGVSTSCTDSGILIPYDVETVPGDEDTLTITVNWRPADEACNYSIFWSTGTILDGDLAGLTPAQTTFESYTHNTTTAGGAIPLIQGDTYHYRVAAHFKDAGGTCLATYGNASAEVTGTVP